MFSNDVILGIGLGYYLFSACCNGIDSHVGHILLCSIESAISLHIFKSFLTFYNNNNKKNKKAYQTYF